MSLLDEQEKYWDKAAGKKVFVTPFHMDKFENYVSHEMRVLDVGCGYGRTLNELQVQGYKNICGIDNAQGMLNKGKTLHPSIDFKKNEGITIPFSDKSFDAIVMIAVLTCIIDSLQQKKLIYEIQRVLKDNGILYISDFLLNHDQRNIERYNYFNDKYATYGVFELDEGAVVRHHMEDYIYETLSCFHKLEYQTDTYITMNGHKSNGFYFIGRKE